MGYTETIHGSVECLCINIFDTIVKLSDLDVLESASCISEVVPSTQQILESYVV